MKKNRLFSTINGIVFGVIFVLIFIESILNILGLWTAWNLFGFLIGLLILPILNIVALISAVESLISIYNYKTKNDSIFMEKHCFLKILFFALGLLLTVIAYRFVFTWGFGV